MPASLEMILIRSSGKTYELARENFSREMERWEQENGRHLADAHSSTIQVQEEWREFIPSAPKPSQIKLVGVFLFAAAGLLAAEAPEHANLC